jgi:phospholipid transport system substrate-binding protein
MKISRKVPSILIAISWFLAFAFTSAQAAPVATEQIRTTVDQALLVLRDPNLRTTGKLKERREQLRQILFARFDFNEMAKRALGTEWRRRSPAEQEEFTRLFTELLERSYMETIESYSNEKIVYLNEKQDRGFANVSSKILTSKGQEYSIEYKAQLVENDWKVYDVVVENISMVNNFRSQFSRVLNTSSYEELLRRLKAKAELSAEKK